MQWGKILLCAVLAAIIALAIIYAGVTILGENPGGILERLCPPENCPDPDSSGNFLQDLFAAIINAIVCAVLCAFVLAIYILLIYFPLAAIIAFLLIRRMVRRRRLIHTIVTVLISLPIAYSLLWLVGQIWP